jgi:hypothetical protein
MPKCFAQIKKIDIFKKNARIKKMGHRLLRFHVIMGYVLFSMAYSAASKIKLFVLLPIS